MYGARSNGIDFASIYDPEQFHRRLAETITWCQSQFWFFHPIQRRKPAWDPPSIFPPQIMDWIAWEEAWKPASPMPSGEGLRTEALRPPTVISNWQTIANRPTVLPRHKELMAPEHAAILRHWREETAHLNDLDHLRQKQEWEDNVEQLAAKRAALIDKDTLAFRDLHYPLQTGRLLVFDPDATVTDGAAAFATQGFINDDDEPGWDTWIAFVIGDPLSGAQQTSLSCDSYLLSWVPDSLIAMVQEGINCTSIDCHYWVDDLDSPFLRELRQAGLIR